MIYGKPLPHIDNILWLSKLAAPYPTTSSAVYEVAEEWRFSKSTLDFLKLFPEDEIFESRSDFINRCEELEMLIREERQMPAEALRSPQD